MFSRRKKCLVVIVTTPRQIKYWQLVTSYYSKRKKKTRRNATHHYQRNAFIADLQPKTNDGLILDSHVYFSVSQPIQDRQRKGNGQQPLIPLQNLCTAESNAMQVDCPKQDLEIPVSLSIDLTSGTEGSMRSNRCRFAPCAV